MQCESALYALLMIYFAKGLMSGALVHKISQAAQEDIDKAAKGWNVQGLNKVASLKHARNLGASLARMMAKESDLPEPFHVHIPLKGAIEETASASLLLPHELFASFYDKGSAWAKCILPDQSLLRKFWDSFQGHPCMENHPCQASTNWKDTCIPLGMHGDEVPCLGTGKVWSKAVLVFSWFSIMSNAAGSSFLDTNIYIWGLFEKFIIEGETMETFWSILVWSFSAMAKGRWPRTDHRGMAFEPGSKGARMANKFLAGGFKGILLQMAGDLDYMTKHLQTPRSTNHEKPCVLCRCKQFGPCSWLDNRPNSLWQRSTVKASNYRTHWDPHTGNGLHALHALGMASIFLWVSAVCSSFFLVT